MRSTTLRHVEDPDSRRYCAENRNLDIPWNVSEMCREMEWAP